MQLHIFYFFLLQRNVQQWHSVFYITAIINFFTNLIFVLFGDTEPQLWSNLDDSRYSDQACHIATITAAYSNILNSIKEEKRRRMERDISDTDS